MRKHGWQLPYHPLQVVAIAVFLALGFAFYVFFVPFVGKKQYEIIVMGLYTPVIACVFFLYIWCAAADPGDPGVFKSKKYLNVADRSRYSASKRSTEGVESIPSSTNKAESAAAGADPMKKAPPLASENVGEKSSDANAEEKVSRRVYPLLAVLLGCCSSRCRERWPDEESSEDGMFYCSLCEVEVHKYSKHCRVCDKCVDGFDHHCRWINNCIGKKNYSRFFVLMLSALLLLTVQFSIGLVVLIRCFIERSQFSADIASKLGSSFSFVPFLVVVGSCTLLAMVAALPIAQLFFFHVLLIKKGISTYDYIVALREEQQGGVGGQLSPQMTPLSSVTGFSSASSFTNFRRGNWCTPPRLFLEDQFDVVPPFGGAAASSNQKTAALSEEPTRKGNPGGAVKISPWTLARLNAEEVAKVAAHARSKSRILQPAASRRAPPPPPADADGGAAISAASRKRSSKRRPDQLPKISSGPGGSTEEASTGLAPLQLEARNAFLSGREIYGAGIAASSPDSSLDSPEHVRQICGDGGGQRFPAQMAAVRLSRSASDGYDASGGEDSDRVPSRIVHRSSNWSNFFGAAERKPAAALTGGAQTSIRLLRPEFGEESGCRL